MKKFQHNRKMRVSKATTRKNKLSVGKLLDLNAGEAPMPDLDGPAANDNPKKQNVSVIKESSDQSLWQCKTIKAVGKLARRWDRKLKKLALKAVERKMISEDLLSLLISLLQDRGATSDPLLIDPGIIDNARKLLFQSLLAVAQANPTFEFAFVTIIDGGFESSDHETVINMFGLKSVSRRILSKMSRDYFAIVELALFNSHKHPNGGRLMSPHTHALIWGPKVISTAERMASHFQLTLETNMTGATPIVVKPVDTDPVNLARMAAYLLKSPHKCKTFYPGTDANPGNMHSSRKSDRYIRYLRLAEIRSMLSIDKVTFASGEGLRLRSGIVQSLRILAKEQARKAPRRFHPDEIQAFWCKLKIALGTTRFNMPVIKTRK